MGDISWFKMTSRRDREKNERKYKERMFPFGEEQRQKELALMSELFPGEKGIDQLLFQLLCAKECIQEEDQEWREEALARWLGGTLMQRYSAEERASILAFAQLEQECANLEDFPDRRQVLARAEELGGI